MRTSRRVGPKKLTNATISSDPQVLYWVARFRQNRVTWSEAMESAVVDLMERCRALEKYIFEAKPPAAEKISDYLLPVEDNDAADTGRVAELEVRRLRSVQQGS